VTGGVCRALDGPARHRILLVMVCHFVLYGGVPKTSSAFDSAVIGVLRTGWIGLDLFFVLSGFLITGVPYDSRGGSHYLRNFHARRVVRILPLFYGSLFLWLVVLPRVWVSHEGSSRCGSTRRGTGSTCST
jgi:peptidoglycan/LPS O-acetylase OafA/YrhL